MTRRQPPAGATTTTEAASPQMMASHIWALSHGTASLFARRAGMSLHSAEELLESAVAIYLRGLGLLPRG